MTVSTETRRSKSLPPWLRRRIPLLPECSQAASVARKLRLHTVCQEALCPNRAECYSKRKVTFIILGDVCTRGCRFCSVAKGKPATPDAGEPRRVARAAAELGLRHVIVTSVTRDDLQDGGAAQFAATIRALRALEHRPTVEVLVPDFAGDSEALAAILDEGPDVLCHNLETVRRLYPEVRPRASYERSLGVIAEAKRLRPGVKTKSALMVGLGETVGEVVGAFGDLRRVGCDFVAIGQYLRPGLDQAPVRDYVTPERFAWFEAEARRLGFPEAAAGPLVRSSYVEHGVESVWALTAPDAGRDMRGGRV
jgi:lipoic acid synthetase